MRSICENVVRVAPVLANDRNEQTQLISYGHNWS
jgi:hypothetical protein